MSRCKRERVSIIDRDHLSSLHIRNEKFRIICRALFEVHVFKVIQDTCRARSAHDEKSGRGTYVAARPRVVCGHCVLAKGMKGSVTERPATRYYLYFTVQYV